MRLISAQVVNFRSVNDSGEFSLDDITCLVGKNEAGKTTILQAIAGLNPHPATPFSYDKERDYPRLNLNNYSKIHGGKNATVVVTRWQLGEDEVEEIEAAFGEGVVSGATITIARRYGDERPEWTISANWQIAINHLISESHFSAPEASQLKSPKNTQELRAALTAIASRSEKQSALLQRIDELPGKSIVAAIQSMLEPHLPRFMYFSNYDRMSGAVRLETVRDQIDSGELLSNSELRGDRLFTEFLDYAGAPLKEILAATRYEPFAAKLQGASNQITDQTLEYWSQNPYISVIVTVDAAKPEDPPPFQSGTVGRARIYNSLHRVDVPFSERSAGFIWFFSFLVKFAKVQDGKPIILLLDEPSLTLHGKAQADLLRYFEEKLGPDHQIIYSTHSPFMVPPDKITSARVVQDIVDTSRGGRPVPIGTQVREDVLSSDPDTVFPLQGALGYEITQTLFIGKHTLLVEGPSDILYLKALSRALERRQRHGLDRRWTLCPAGGIGNIRAFVSLFRGNTLNVVAVSDYSAKDRTKIENLRKTEVLKAGAVLTMDQFTGKSEADTEDLFSPEVFAQLLNRAYALEGTPQALDEPKLEGADTTTPRLVKKAEAFFRVLPSSVPDFDHYRPSEWLLENPAFLDQTNAAMEATLDRAEALFVEIDKLLVSHVPCQGGRREASAAWRERAKAVELAEAAQNWGWSSETTVDQTLIRGLGTAFRVFVSGLSSV